MPIRLLLACIALLVTLPAFPQDRPPNIILVLVDDMGWMDLGESENLAESRPGRVEELDRLLLKRLNADGAKLPRENPEFRPR